MVTPIQTLRIANTPFNFSTTEHWAKAGVQNIEDLVHDDFTVITSRDFREKYRLSASFLEFCGVTWAIRSAMKSLKLPNWKRSGAAKSTKLAYEILIKNSTNL